MILVLHDVQLKHSRFCSEHSQLRIFPTTDQEERQWAIQEFKQQRKDVLVATDIAGKGLDFPNIQHVINYDMPADIENYGGLFYVGLLTITLLFIVVHRIGRTGRCGKTGIATTFVNKLCGKMIKLSTVDIHWHPCYVYNRGVGATGSKGSANGSKSESASFPSSVGCS